MTRIALTLLVPICLISCNNNEEAAVAAEESTQVEEVATTEHDHTARQLYLDVHHLGAGNVTAADVAEAHEKDLKVQGKYDVNFLKYWVDESTGDVYCLSESAGHDNITAAHKEAHGLIPDDVYKVTDGEAAIPAGDKTLYLDIHELGPGNVTAEAVEEAHQKDLAVQGHHHVNFINYWVDEEKGYVFCLSEAESRDDVIATHTEAHGLIPAQVITVKQGE